MMPAYQVGAPYNPSRTRWPETPFLRLLAEGHELVLFLGTPTRAETQGLRNGVAEFAWIDAGPVALLAYRFEPGIPWSDCPYTPHLEKPGTTAHMPTLADGQHLLVQVTLVDATTGLVAALRALTWPAAFANAVGDSVRRMAAEPYDAAAVDRALAEVYREFPLVEGSARLAASRAVATCVGWR